MSDDYRLIVRADAARSRRLPREEILARLRRIPGVETVAPAALAFGEEDEHGRMHLVLVGDEDCEAVEVAVPRPWVHARGPSVFALVFMLAEWSRWEVYDPQIDDVLQKEAVLSGLVAMRQAQREAERRASDAPAPPERATPPPEERRRPWWKRG